MIKPHLSRLLTPVSYTHLIITAQSLLRMLPPLNITKEEIDLALDILEKTLKENFVLNAVFLLIFKLVSKVKCIDDFIC